MLIVPDETIVNEVLGGTEKLLLHFDKIFW